MKQPTAASDSVDAASKTDRTALPNYRGQVSGSLVVAAAQAYVANDDPPAIHAFDFRAGRELWTADLESTPAHLAIATTNNNGKNESRLFVAMRDLDRVDVVSLAATTPPAPAPKPFAKTACTEPVGLALTTDESTLLVACAWSHELVGISVQNASVLWHIDLPLEPRAVIVTRDGASAVVSHAVGGRATVVDLKSRRIVALELRGGVVSKGTGGFGAVLPGAALMTSNGFALAEYEGTVYTPTFASMTDRGPNPGIVYYGSSFDEGIVFPIVASNADAKNRWLYARVPARPPSAKPFLELRGCLAPRGVAIRPTGPKTDPDSNAEAPSTRLVACPGNDQIIEHDQTGAAIRRIVVPGGPSAIAMTDNDTAVVWSRASRQLSTLDLRVGAVAGSIVAGTGGGAPTRIAANDRLKRGRVVFERVDDGRISSSGRGCASCHPDGRADALTWGTPEGPRQTMMLASRLQGTSPYGWTRGIKTLHGYVGETVRRLGGTGLPKDDLDALITYVGSLQVPEAARFTAVIKEIASARGKSIFESSEAGCSGCHSGALFADGISHDVGSSHHPSTAASGSAERVLFDTPSLRFINNTAPYFHDGRYPSLRALLLDPDGKMGRTKHLNRDDIDALESYLRTL